MAVAESPTFAIIVLLFLLILGLIFSQRYRKDNSEQTQETQTRSTTTPETPESPETTDTPTREPTIGTEREYEFLDDFRKFREFMSRRKSNNLDMGPLAASSAFSGAYYSGNLELDHKPLRVILEIDKLYNANSTGNQLDLTSFKTAGDDLAQEISETVELYENIENYDI